MNELPDSEFFFTGMHHIFSDFTKDSVIFYDYGTDYGYMLVGDHIEVTWLGAEWHVHIYNHRGCLEGPSAKLTDPELDNIVGTLPCRFL
jgi:hypothetical protein